MYKYLENNRIDSITTGVCVIIAIDFHTVTKGEIDFHLKIGGFCYKIPLYRLESVDK